MADRACLACGEPVGGTRRRKYCDDRCKRRYHRGARAKGATPEAAAPSPPGQPIGSTEAATMFELQEAKRLGTPLGQAALVLARRLDASHMDTGAGIASLAKQLQATLAAATAEAHIEDDPVDEVRARRDEKLRAAAG